MSDESQQLQLENLAAGRNLVEDYDLGAAARESSRQGRGLTRAEFESFRYDRRTSVLPRKTLLFDGERYAFV